MRSNPHNKYFARKLYAPIISHIGSVTSPQLHADLNEHLTWHEKQRTVAGDYVRANEL